MAAIDQQEEVFEPKTAVLTATDRKHPLPNPQRLRKTDWSGTNQNSLVEPDKFSSSKA
jgi:hypothetical protein